MTEIESHKVFAILCALFPSAKTEPWERAGDDGRMIPVPGGGTRGAYARMFADLEYAAACAAVEQVAATHRFPTVLPAIGEIRAVYVEITRGATRDGIEAWGDVIAAIRKYGNYRTPSFADPLVAEAVNAIGWQTLCSSTNAGVDRAHFREVYESLSEKNRRESVVGTLPATTRYKALQERSEVTELVGKVALKLAGGS